MVIIIQSFPNSSIITWSFCFINQGFNFLTLNVINLNIYRNMFFNTIGNSGFRIKRIGIISFQFSLDNRSIIIIVIISIYSVNAYIINKEDEGIVGNTLNSDINILIVITGKVINIFSPSDRCLHITCAGNNLEVIRINLGISRNTYFEPFQSILCSIASSIEFYIGIGA